MAPINLKKGLALNLAGKPAPEINDFTAPDVVHMHPAEFEGIKPRMDVKEGDKVKKGSILFHSKVNPNLKFRAPAGGTVQAIVLGARRSLQDVQIKIDPKADSESFTKTAADKMTSLSREDILNQLLETGYLSFIRQRPFSRIADPSITPKSIFVNGMHTGAFQPELNIVLQGDEDAFQAGLDLLSRLTDGKVHLCLPDEAPSKPLSDVLINPRNAEVHHFAGPNPAGQTSVHIHHLDPIIPGQNVWTVNATDLILIGKLFLNGELPSTRIISLGGPGVKADACSYYRVQQGTDLSAFLEGKLEDGEQRIVSGDVLTGTRLTPEKGIPMNGRGITVLPEGRERHFLGWMGPGLDRFSDSPLYLSKWLVRGKAWKLNTNLNGSRRAMVLTGLYDRYLPMNIMVDYLVRACLARDTDEAIKLGLLETEPEDFAVCAFACPSKMDLVSVIRDGLNLVEEEGI